MKSMRLIPDIYFILVIGIQPSTTLRPASVSSWVPFCSKARESGYAADIWGPDVERLPLIA